MQDVDFQGVFVPNVTPFKGGEIDEPSLRRLVDYLIEAGASGLVPCGTTGESATLSHDEHIRVIETVVEQVSGRVPVIAGIGTNDTRESIRLLGRAESLDCQGYLVVGPYYNRPNQEGIIEHFRAVSGETDRPMLIYNIPARTGKNIDGRHGRRAVEDTEHRRDQGRQRGHQPDDGDHREDQELLRPFRGGPPALQHVLPGRARRDNGERSRAPGRVPLNLQRRGERRRPRGEEASLPPAPAGEDDVQASPTPLLRRRR